MFSKRERRKGILGDFIESFFHLVESDVVRYLCDDNWHGFEDLLLLFWEFFSLETFDEVFESQAKSTGLS